MSAKDLKDWSLDDLVTAATWKVMDDILKGELRNGVHAAILLAFKWRMSQPDVAAAPTSAHEKE